MSRLLIENSQIWQEDRFVSGQTLIISDGQIRDLLPASDVEARPGDRHIDCHGAYVLPGFVELHIHGSNGFDVMDASSAALQGICDFLVMQGVTSFLGTTMADSAERIDAALSAMNDFAGQAHSPLLGVHLEGPYLNAAFRGSQPEARLRQPCRAEYLPWLAAGQIKLTTLAPEIAGADRLIEDARALGITVAMGHSGADYQAATEYFAAGVSQITHTFNSMPGIHHRQPGPFVAAWENPEVTFEIIADGAHLHPAMVKMIVQLVGSERVVAVTDAMRAAGQADGQYLLGDVVVTVEEGVSRSSTGRLAGSTLTMPQALKNLMRFCDLTLAEALPMLTRVPARSIGMYPRKGSLQIGADADIVIWNDTVGVQATLIAGEPVYQAAAALSG